MCLDVYPERNHNGTRGIRNTKVRQPLYGATRSFPVPWKRTIGRGPSHFPAQQLVKYHEGYGLSHREKEKLRRDQSEGRSVKSRQIVAIAQHVM